MLPAELRVDLSPFRDLTIEEIKKKLTESTEVLQALDTRRFNLHRFIEFFAFKYFCGRSPAKVRWDIERHIESCEKEVYPIITDIYGTREENGDYSIAFGEGEDYASGSYGDYDEEESPAVFEEGDYKSKIAPRRSFEDDKDLIARIGAALNQRYPLLEVANRFSDWRSFHEAGRSFGFYIDGFSLNEVAEKEGIKDPKVILDSIFEIIRTLVKAESAPATVLQKPSNQTGETKPKQQAGGTVRKEPDKPRVSDLKRLDKPSKKEQLKEVEEDRSFNAHALENGMDITVEWVSTGYKIRLKLDWPPDDLMARIYPSIRELISLGTINPDNAKKAFDHAVKMARKRKEYNSGQFVVASIESWLQQHELRSSWYSGPKK